MLCYSLRSFQYGLKAKKNTYKSMIFASKEGVVFEKMVESLLVMGAGAGAGEKKNRRRSATLARGDILNL